MSITTASEPLRQAASSQRPRRGLAALGRRLQLGRWRFGPGQLPLTGKAIALGLRSAPIQTIQVLGEANLLALGGWALVAPALAAGCYGLGLTAMLTYRNLRARAKSNPIRNHP